MKILFFVLALVYSALFPGCGQEYDSAKQVRQLNTADTFLFELPKEYGQFDSLFYKNKIYNEKALKLESLEKGFDSIQMRFWYGGFGGERLVILINKGNKWDAEVGRVDSYPNPDYDRQTANRDYYWLEDLPSRAVEHKAPKSGWERFINTLFKLNALTLPDQQNIKDFQEMSVNDGERVVAEIAAKNVYRLYTYRNPELYLDKHSEMKNISQILKLIDEEFGLEKLWDYINENPKDPKSDTVTKIKVREIQLQDIEAPKKKKKR